jgi:hypothetical protein
LVNLAGALQHETRLFMIAHLAWSAGLAKLPVPEPLTLSRAAARIAYARRDDRSADGSEWNPD